MFWYLSVVVSLFGAVIPKEPSFSYVYTTNYFQKHNVKCIYKGALHCQSSYNILSSLTVKEKCIQSIINQSNVKSQHNSTQDYFLVPSVLITYLHIRWIYFRREKFLLVSDNSSFYECPFVYHCYLTAKWSWSYYNKFYCYYYHPLPHHMSPS